jgi:Cu/Ag efflux protein CusF
MEEIPQSPPKSRCKVPRLSATEAFFWKGVASMRQQNRCASIPAVIVIVAAVGLVRFAAAADEPAKSREPGGAVTIGATATAIVKAIDPDKRTVTIQGEDGDTHVIKCGQEVRNFDQIKVGDQVKAAAIARLVVAVGKGDAGAASPQDGTIVARAPKGSKPGAIIVSTEQRTAKVESVDAAKQTVTLQGLDDKPQTVEVAPDVDLSGVKPGDAVTVRLSKGVALWVVSGGASEDVRTAAAAVKPEAGVEGVAKISLEKATATATVDAIDPATRTVTLKSADGGTRSIKLGKECVNFDQIKVGDQVRATLAQEIVVSVRKAGTQREAGVTGTAVALAPKGAKPGIIVVDTDEITAQIKSIDAANSAVTLTDADGATKTIKVGPDVKLSELKTGDDVTARVTQEVAIVVEKP